MTEKSGCRKTQDIRELLSNRCSDEDCLRLADHLDKCQECRNDIDSSVGQMSRMLATLRAGQLDNTSREPALGAAVEQLLAYDPAAATQTERTELLWTLSSSMLPPHIGPYKVIDSIDRDGMGFARKMTTRLIVVACAVILVCAFAGAELWGVTQVTASVIHTVRGDGTLIIDINGPEIHVSIDGGTIEMIGSDTKEVRLRPGKHHLQATRGGIPFKNEDVIITRRGKRLLHVVWKPSERIQVEFPPLTDQRKAIGYVLGLGGKVQILVNWAIVSVSSVGELPPSSFDIESLNLSDNSLVADSDLLHFTALHSLHKLYLTRTHITDVGLEQIAKFSELKVLSVSTTQVTDKGIRRLTALQELDKLDLERTGITDEGLKRICGLPKLSRLNLKYTRVTDQGMTEIPRLKNLEVLYVAGTSVTDKSIDNIKKLASLRELMLSGTGFTESGIARLKSLLLHCTFAVNEESHLW